jgi:hypothetical protein
MQKYAETLMNMRTGRAGVLECCVKGLPENRIPFFAFSAFFAVETIFLLRQRGFYLTAKRAKNAEIWNPEGAWT